MSYLIHFNKNHDSKTGRFTFSNQKWMKTENSNGNRDSDSLAKTMSKYGNSYADYLNSSKTTYFTDKNGKVMYREDGSPRGLFVHDVQKKNVWDNQVKKYLNEKEILKKKYKDVQSHADLTDDGWSFIKVRLTDKLDNVYTTELKTKYAYANFNRRDFVKAPF